MIALDIDVPISDIPVLDLAAAESQIRSANEERDQEADEANQGGDMDDFRYLRTPWFILETERGRFVASIRNAGGGGCGCPSGTCSHLNNAFIEYDLHFRIEEAG